MGSPLSEEYLAVLRLSVEQETVQSHIDVANLLDEVARLRAERDALLGLDAAGVDALLDRWDQTEPHIQRAIVVKLAGMVGQSRSEREG